MFLTHTQYISEDSVQCAKCSRVFFFLSRGKAVQALGQFTEKLHVMLFTLRLQQAAEPGVIQH